MFDDHRSIFPKPLISGEKLITTFYPRPYHADIGGLSVAIRENTAENGENPA